MNARTLVRFALAFSGLLWRWAWGQPAPTIEHAGPAVTRFFASAEARREAHPSYALLDEIVWTSAPEGFVPAQSPGFYRAGARHGVTWKIARGTSLYGTGEAAGPLLRNGRRIVCWNTDAYGYSADAESLYQAHPWVLGVRADGSAFGLLADTTYRCEVDTALADAGEVRFIADGPSFGLVVIEAPGPEGVLEELARLTGKMPMPPRWALGYHQCRYSYYPASRVREVAREFRARGIPADVIWMDIDYMEAFRVFTFDRGFFPDPGALNRDLRAMGFRNVWMIDPGIKADDEPGPSDRLPEMLASDGPEAAAARAKELEMFAALRESGRRAGVYVTNAAGEEYRGAVWPGACVFPDYTSPAVRGWWAALYSPFLANGISGVWNDMNEPAVFNVKSKTMPLDNRHAGDPAMKRPDGTPQGEAAAGDHARYHNVYGMQMIRGTREGILAARPDERPFVLSRANYLGGQRYGATWTGDNSATWEHLELSIPMTLNVGLSGQPFIGPDIGGFAANGDGALFARWMGFGAMLPFARGHTGKENIAKEPWAFGDKVEATCREAIRRRYRLLPYYYTVFREASERGLPVARPLFFADPADAALRAEDDGFLIGRDVMVVASVVPDRTRVPVLPRGVWREFERSDDPDLPRLFLRGGAIVPSGPDVAYSDEKPLDPLTLWVCPDEHGRAEGLLYEDAGDGHGHETGEYLRSRYRAELTGDALTLRLVSGEGDRARPPRRLVVRVVLEGRTLVGEGRDGEAVVVPLR